MEIVPINKKAEDGLPEFMCRGKKYQLQVSPCLHHGVHVVYLHELPLKVIAPPEMQSFVPQGETVKVPAAVRAVHSRWQCFPLPAFQWRIKRAIQSMQRELTREAVSTDLARKVASSL